MRKSGYQHTKYLCLMIGFRTLLQLSTACSPDENWGLTISTTQVAPEPPKPCIHREISLGTLVHINLWCLSTKILMP